MFRFLRDFEFNRVSFWLGFLAATLLWWLIWRFKPIFESLLRSLRERIREAREGLTATTEARYKAELVRYTQSLHIASPIFSLDEILIEPRLLAPPPPPWAENAHINEHIASQSVSYMPDWPEIGSEFKSPNFLLPEVLAGDTHIAIISEPGTGKTTALAYLISSLAREEKLPQHLIGTIPVYIHAGELLAASEGIHDLNELLYHTAGLHVSGRTRSRLKELLNLATESGRVLLILDDLDEPSPEVFDRVLEILVSLLQNQPKMRAIVAASPHYTGELARAGFSYLPLASWTSSQKVLFLDQWGKMWEKHVAFLGDENRDLEPALLNAWLLEDTYPGATPLEMTLLAWGAYAGDSRGRSVTSALQAAVYRLAALGDPSADPKLIDVAAEIAFEMIKERSAWVAPGEIKVTLNETDPGSILEPVSHETTQNDFGKSVEDSGQHVSLRNYLEVLKLGGLLRTILPTQIAFSHQILLSYLASCSSNALSMLSNENRDHDRSWSAAIITQRFTLQRNLAPKSVIDDLANSGKEPLFSNLLNLARALGGGIEDESWKTPFLRQLANLVQNETFPLGLRARALTALIHSETGALNTLLQRLCGSQHPIQRQLGALGFGFAKIESGIETLIKLLGDSTPNVYRAASISLVAIGTDAGLHAIAEMLLSADEDRRKAAAEALAVHPEEGHPTLREGAELEDLLVRRAVVFGLQRVRERWAMEKLEELQLNDAQWVVKNAAGQALDELNSPDPRLPSKLIPLKETPWLIAFAAEKGEGISGNQAANEMLLQALRDGNETQKLSALKTIVMRGEEFGIQPIFNLVYSEGGEVSEAALQTLWYMESWGVNLPNPAKFGLGTGHYAS